MFHEATKGFGFSGPKLMKKGVGAVCTPLPTIWTWSHPLSKTSMKETRNGSHSYTSRPDHMSRSFSPGG